MSFGDKVIDLFMPTKKESRQNSEPAVNKQKPEVEDFTKRLIAIACIHYSRLAGNSTPPTSSRARILFGC